MEECLTNTSERSATTTSRRRPRQRPRRSTASQAAWKRLECSRKESGGLYCVGTGADDRSEAGRSPNSRERSHGWRRSATDRCVNHTTLDRRTPDRKEPRSRRVRGRSGGLVSRGRRGKHRPFRGPPWTLPPSRRSRQRQHPEHLDLVPGLATSRSVPSLVEPVSNRLLR